MLRRLKQALVESFVGAIALGYLLAQMILHFTNIFAAPIARWVSRKEYGGMMPKTSNLPGFSLQDALPELARFIVLPLVWYVLVWWLYVKPMESKAPHTEIKAES
jgi:hypothetical protein